MSERVNSASSRPASSWCSAPRSPGSTLDGDRVTGVHWDGGTREADLVVVAIGVRPATDFLAGQRPRS